MFPIGTANLLSCFRILLAGMRRRSCLFILVRSLKLLEKHLSTLKFAEQFSMVELGAARTNKNNAQVYELREQAALAKKEGEAEHFPTQPVKGDIPAAV
ncbi:kinesin-4-like [Trifolium medium]|uniref:Kinesin-4-like n=1 Tax=Trifolium medium TaxID=97028 RepID=A0A392MQ13_9FABA|nr:kinesin-4-like [Trifolium medium]